MKSRYSKAYVKPLKRLDDNNTYESERLYAPVKARKTTDNVAHYHDPLVEWVFISVAVQTCEIFLECMKIVKIASLGVCLVRGGDTVPYLPL